MKKFVIRSASVLVAFGFVVGSAMAAEASKLDPKKPVKSTVEVTAKKGKSAEVKVTGDDTKNSTAPKKAERADSSHCDIHIDNRTNLYVNRVYIDGRNWGSVGKLGDSLAEDVSNGRTTLYAEMDWTDGSTSHYGPTVFNCEAWTTHRWVIR